MTLRLHDSATGAVREFTPLVPGRAGIYLCGATPQSSPHVGHLRSAIAFDVLARWLRIGHGLDVTLVRNVTDIDDKVLEKSQAAGVPWWAWAQRFEREFTAAYDAVGVEPPAYEPRATGHVPQMVELIEELVARGHAYPAADGSGDVFFDVLSWPDYGSLSHVDVDDVVSAADADPRGKRDPRDFALWKGRKESEPATASWATPFGPGRPGWHLECSAMARRYLGPAFDVHGGGLDLRFPHHENEQAQSRAAGDPFASCWLHNGLVRVGGQKMGKSLGNALSVSEVLRTVSPLVLRWALAGAHYRSVIEYGPQTLADARAALGRVEHFLARAAASRGADASSGGTDGAGSTVPGAGALPAAFVAAMDDDLNVPAALAALFAAVREGNTALDVGGVEVVAASLRSVTAMLDVLGVDPRDPRWSGSAAGTEVASAERAALESLVRDRLDARADARAAKDFAAADVVRDALAAAGVVVADTPQGATWSLAQSAATQLVPVRPLGRSRPGPDPAAPPRRLPCPVTHSVAERCASPAPRRGRRSAPAGCAAAVWKGAGRPRGPRSAPSTSRPSGPPGLRPPRAAPDDVADPRGSGRPSGRSAAPARGAAPGRSVRARARRGAPRGRARLRVRPGARVSGTEVVAGRNAVLEALRAGIPASSLHLADRLEGGRDDRVREALSLAGERGLPVLETTRGDLERLAGDAVHQGVVLRVPPYEHADLADVLGGRPRGR